MNKYAILSTDNNPDYYNLLPLVCYSWKKLGYTPVIVTVGLPYEIHEKLEKFCGAVMMAGDLMDGVKPSTIAQLSRLFVYGKFNDDDILITGDADMVIAMDIFTHDADIVSYGFDLTGRSELPICYVKATAGKWCELMGEYHIPEKAYSSEWSDYWSVDQQLLTQRAKEYGMEKIMFIDRGNNGPGGLPTGRWDRHGWVKPAEIIDVHMKRNDMKAQFEVFHTLWPNDDDRFLCDYFESFAGITSPKSELSKIAENDKHWFLPGITGNWENHRPLLLLSLSLTNNDVIELGSGKGSTPFFRDFCNDAGRKFNTYESEKEWAEPMNATYVEDWDRADIWHPCGLLFVDHAPGEHRHIAIARMAGKADIIVIHDTEEGGAGDYKFDRIWPLFKYRLNFNKNGGGAGATAVSNKIDLNRFRGLSLGEYTFDAD